MMVSALRRAIDDAATAWLFLTRVPVPWNVADVAGRLPRAMPWFPVVGVFVGAVGGVAAWVGASVWGSVAGALLAVATTALVTGAFHEDGLADTFDGLGGGASRSEALAIMGDSRVGTFGTMALGLVTALRVTALAGLGGLAPLALVGAHAIGRYTSLVVIRWLPYARRNGGAAEAFQGGMGWRALLVATSFTLAVTLGLWGLPALGAWAAAAAATLLIGCWLKRRLGGMTGDGLGAANQVSETACYLALWAQLG